MRTYHSVSLLLPDGTVLHGASGNAMVGSVAMPDQRNHEIFSPPYLFKGARPTITDAPTSVGYGETFTLATPNAAQVTDVRWIHIGSVTHAFDAGQRANTLSFTPTATGVSVTAPAVPTGRHPGPLPGIHPQPERGPVEGEDHQAAVADPNVIQIVVFAPPSVYDACQHR